MRPRVIDPTHTPAPTSAAASVLTGTVNSVVTSATCHGNGGAFQLSPQGFRAPVAYEMLHCLIDELAALAGPDHPINGFDGRFRQNNVDAFAHRYED